ncbi:LuxR C-terminal-related transcriptional regulator [Corynebacterium hindlerae]|uniref:LuxR C-terminal-related transcriptional regulator n=1 Tax=Corynebacterium hindlerae TaxID=699041 RepID=UPI0031B6DA21
MITARDDSRSLAVSGDPRILADRIHALEPGTGLIVHLTAPAGSGKKGYVHELLQLFPGWFTHRVNALPWCREDQGHLVRHLFDDDLSRIDSESAAHLIVVDDAQWADSSSIESLCTVARRLRRSRVAVVFSTIPHHEPELTGMLGTLADFEITIPPLGLAEVHKMGKSVLGISLSASVCSRLLEMSGGRPGRIREILSTRNLEHWQDSDAAVPVPLSWQESLAQRCSSLSPNAVTALNALSIFRESCPLALLQQLADDPDLTAIDELVHARLLRIYSSSTGQRATISDAPDRAVLYSALPPGEQAGLHRRAAAYFSQHSLTSEASLHQALGSVTCSDTFALLLAEHGKQLNQEGKWLEAHRFFDQASKLTSDRSLHHKFRLDSIEAIISASDIATAHVLSSGLDPKLNKVRVSSMLGTIAIHEGRRSEAKAFLNSAAELFDADPAFAPRLGSRMTLLSIAQWQPTQAVHWASRTKSVSPHDTNLHIEAEAIAIVGRAALERSGASQFELPPDAAPFQVQRVNMAQGWVRLVYDDPIEARELLRVRFENEGSERISLWQDAWLARANLVLGDWRSAQQDVERGLARAERFGIPLLEPLLLWTGTQLAHYTGDLELARYYSSRLVSGRDSFIIQRLPSLMGRLTAANLTNDVKGCVRVGEQLLQLRDSLEDYAPEFWPWEDVFLQALIRDGQTRRAAELLDRFEAEASPAHLQSIAAKLSVPRGHLLILNGDLEGGVAVLDDAVEQIAALPMPMYESRIVFEFGQILRRHGQRRRADAMFRRATELFSELGATTFVERAFREQRAVGLGPRSHKQDELTPQELEIAQLVAAGATNRDVATELFLSVKTVEYHLTRVYRKLRVRRRNELATALRAEGSA